MTKFKVMVRWKDGLHMRPAARLVNTAKHFHSTIFVKCGEQMADLRSIVSIVSLCATMGMTLDVTASGDDEHDAAQAIERVFSAHCADTTGSMTRPGS